MRPHAHFAIAIAAAFACRAAPTAPPDDTAKRSAPPPTEPAKPPPEEDPTADPALLEGAAAEREQYERALATASSVDATCRRDPDSVDVSALVEAYATLAPYEQSPDRDAAIVTLERCRQALSGVVEKTMPTKKADAGKADFTADLETAIRKANARSTKNLTVTVEGSKVTIKKKGKTGKKKKDEKKALDGYCAMTSAPTVTRITMVTDDAEMSCSPKFEFSKQGGYVDRRIGIAAPFEVESIEKKKIPKP